MSGGERRTSPRILFDGPTIVVVGEQPLSCNTHDLSNSGILVFPPARARPGIVARVRLDLPEIDDLLEAWARLVREAVVSGRYAWGLRFERIAPHAATVLRSFVRRALRGADASQPSVPSQPIVPGPGLDALVAGATQPARPTPLTPDGPGPLGSDAEAADEGDLPALPAGGARHAPAGGSDPFADLPGGPVRASRVDDVAETHLALREARLADDDDGEDLWDDRASARLRRLFRDAVEDVGDGPSWKQPEPPRKKGWFGK